MNPTPASPILTDRYHSAIGLALELHYGHVRKGTTIPYISHLLSVSSLVLDTGGDEDPAIAALLHDAVEDADGMSGEEVADLIRRRFGDRVADIVLGCSDTVSTGGTAKPPWRTRKEAYLEKLRHEPDDVVRVSLADKVHKARSIASDQDRLGDELWSRFNATRDDSHWYYSSLRAVYAERLPGNPLIRELDLAIQRIWPEK
ncbi:MAG: hypothetical protein RLZ37_2076 [Actinomycetota bacterium]|jgi:(p)ppGpp synthase/HD superfamily hydrolase